MKKTVILFQLVILILIAGCSQENQIPDLPPSLAGISLQEEITGKASVAVIAKLHRKEVAPLESTIGYYESGEKPTTLYVITYESVDKARQVLGDMSGRIGNGSSGFWHHRTFSVKDRKIQMVLGQGQVHYFFVKDKSVYWLAIQSRKANAALAELLEVQVTKIDSQKK